MSFITFAGFTIDMHGSTSFLLILLDVIAELGIHERFLTVSTAVLHVFCPQKLFADFIAEQLLVNVSGVKHPFIGCDLIWKNSSSSTASISFSSSSQEISNSLARFKTRLTVFLAVGNVLLIESQTTKLEDLSILGHSHDLL